MSFLLVIWCDTFFCSNCQRNFIFITTNILYFGIKIIINNFFMFSNYMFSVIFFLMKNTSTLFLNYITLNSLFFFFWSILINICSFLLFFLIKFSLNFLEFSFGNLVRYLFLFHQSKEFHFYYNQYTIFWYKNHNW